ncbi:MAG: DUF1223 domain-containing protein [Methylococcales bacterium]|nr:DUF1223 domain-containing protein [Methylococcales bacterium]
MELYTSQGCSSCPPTESWLADLQNNGFSPEHVIPVALHVDYWDYIGWKDKFASAKHTLRQRRHVKQNGLNTLYTPQLILSGKDLRPRNKLKKSLASITTQAAPANIQLQAVVSEQNVLSITCTVSVADNVEKKLKLNLMITENNLTTAIRAGENLGKKLHHEHVVRQILEPSLVTTEPHHETLPLNPNWHQKDLEIVAFIENNAGDVLQTLVLPLR